MSPASRHALLLAFCSAAAACSAEPTHDDASRARSDALSSYPLPIKWPPPLPPPPPPVKPQSFLPPESWSKDFASSTGWDPSRHVRLLADIDSDGKQDIVAFGDAGVYIAHSLGTSFEPAQFVLAEFGTANGWTVDNHIRTMADINADGRPDIVAFGNDGVWTALSTGTGFGPPAFVLADFGYNQGWRVGTHVRLMADVNGDGYQDIVGFGNAGVYTSLSGPGGFGPTTFVIANFGADQGWDPALHVRTTGDINGDGMQDIVAFGYDGVWTALSTGAWFAAPQFVLAQYGSSPAAGGWVAGGRHERRVVDFNGDRKADIIGFGESGVWTSLSTGAGGFSSTVFTIADFGFSQMGWAVDGDAPRMIGDFNGDGYVDIVGYVSDETIRRSLGGPGGTFAGPVDVMTTFSRIGGWVASGDVNGDALPDLIGYSATDVMVERSSASPVPPPPIAPSNLRTLGVSPTALTLGWDDSGTDEQAFVISYTNQGTGVQQYASAGASDRSKTLTGLAPASLYCFTVSAVGYYGTSAPSPQFCDTTLLQGPTIALTASTHTSLGFTITGTGATMLRWDLDGVTPVTTESGSTASPVFDQLTPGTQYCLRAAQEVGATWSVDSVDCVTTPAIQTGTTTLTMPEDPPPYTGYISYSGVWTPAGRTITGFTSVYGLGEGIAFVKPGHDPTTDCGSPDAVLLLVAGHPFTASDVAQVSWTQPNGTIAFVGCPAGMPNIATLLFVNVNWSE